MRQTLHLVVIASVLAACQPTKTLQSLQTRPAANPGGIEGAVLWDPHVKGVEGGEQAANAICERHGLKAELGAQTPSGNSMKTDFVCRDAGAASEDNTSQGSGR
jgi:hypothetical protein